MYCPNCGAKLPDKNTKYCPVCGAPIINQKKSNPIFDAIILGSIIVLFIFAVIKISQLITDYRLDKISKTQVNSQTIDQKKSKLPKTPEVRAPHSPGNFTFKEIKDPKVLLTKKIQSALKGLPNETSIDYIQMLQGYQVDVTIFKNERYSQIDYLNLIANILAIAYSDRRNNVKFVVCKVKDKNKIKLFIAVGAEAASKIPTYTWNMFGRNGMALIRWIEQHQSLPNVSKVFICRYTNNF